MPAPLLVQGAVDRGDGRQGIVRAGVHVVNAGFGSSARRGVVKARKRLMSVPEERLVAGAWSTSTLIARSRLASSQIARASHREGEGIALRAIERDPADAVAQFVEDVLTCLVTCFGRLAFVVPCFSLIL